jgi:hypothetical protein
VRTHTTAGRGGKDRFSSSVERYAKIVYNRFEFMGLSAAEMFGNIRSLLRFTIRVLNPETVRVSKSIFLASAVGAFAGS